MLKLIKNSGKIQKIIRKERCFYTKFNYDKPYVYVCVCVIYSRFAWMCFWPIREAYLLFYNANDSGVCWLYVGLANSRPCLGLMVLYLMSWLQWFQAIRDEYHYGAKRKLRSNGMFEILLIVSKVSHLKKKVNRTVRNKHLFLYKHYMEYIL